MEHICPNCDRIFPRKRNLDNHIIKNACKTDKYFCKLCEKGFTTQTNMYRHMRINCFIKRENEKEKVEIYEKLLTLENENKKIKEDNDKKLEMLKKENQKLKKDIILVKKQMNQTTIKTTNINNGVINNNIILVGYGKEDLSKLNKSELLKILQNGYNSTIKLTEALHFNPKFPEYHNVYISNIKDKYAMMFDGANWTLTTKEDLINKIYDDKKNYIEENLEDFLDSLTESRKKALERWLETDENDDKIKKIKDGIKLLLYNKKNIIIDLDVPKTTLRVKKTIR